MSSVLVARSAAAAAHLHPLGLSATRQPDAPSPAAGDFGLRPQDLHAAYALPTAAPTSQTIAIIDAYNDPAAETDLRTYDEAFSLPSCTTANGCFKQVNQHGETSNLPFPKTLAELETARSGSKPEAENAEEATGWGLEISLDIETAHSVCQSCQVVLVEATEPVDLDLEAAEHAAESLGATEISNSYGGPEEGTTAHEAAGPFNHPGTVITASAGDNGYLDWNSGLGAVEFPAASPHVVAVGGTRLKLGAGSSWSGRDDLERGRRRRRWLQHDLRSPRLAAVAGELVRCGVPRDAGGGGHLSRRRPLHRRGRVGLDQLRMRNELHGRQNQTRAPLVHARRHEPRLADHRFGVRARGRQWWRLLSRLHAVRERATTPSALHDVTSGSNGECSAPFNPSNGISGCTIEQEAAACSSHRDLSRRQRLRRSVGAGNARRAGRLRAPAGERQRRTPRLRRRGRLRRRHPSGRFTGTGHRRTPRAHPTRAKMKAKTKKKNRPRPPATARSRRSPSARPPRRGPPVITSPSSPSPSPPVPPCMST